MASKNYYFQLIFRVLLLTASIFLFAFSFLKEYYILTVIALLLSIVYVLTLIRYINQTNRKIAYFFNSIKNEDFTLQFPEEIKPKSLKELHHSMNKVNELIKDIQIKNRSQENYYQEILKHTKTGILTINTNGHILFANPSIKKLFNKEQLNHLRQLKTVDVNLYTLLSELKPFDRKLIKFTNERETLHVIIKSTEITLNNTPLKLVTIEDINNELDVKETESWTKLIQVLAHEIMNTIAPINSISESIIKYYKKNEEIVTLASLNDEHIRNTVKGLEVIKNQGKDLMSFVKSYRSVLNVPTPEKEIINLKELFEKIEVLVHEDIKSKNIAFNVTIPAPDFEIFADKKQISLVITNLLKNAIQSLNEKDNGVITIRCGVNEKKQKYIYVKDNGPGIQPELLQQIFIPFFTTKSSGSGIGLSLSKQILQIHGGALKVYSDPKKETVFTLIF